MNKIEKQKRYNRIYYQLNKERLAAYAKDYQRKNRERLREYGRQYYRRKIGAPIFNNKAPIKKNNKIVVYFN